MLVIISDIHFVDGTAGEHNLPYGAFDSVFLADVAALAVDKKAKELKIVLLGDIVDIIRSTQWFDKALPEEERPWGKRGMVDVSHPRAVSPTEKQCLKIFGQVQDKDLKSNDPPNSLNKNTILHKNWDTFKLFREIPQRLKSKFKLNIPVDIIYIPGNHDRLCNLYPSLRDALRKTLGLTINAQTVLGDPKGEWWYRYDYEDENYALYARHGHQYDIWNYGGYNDHSRPAHLQVPIGDVLTTEFAVKIPYTFELLKKKYKQITTTMVDSLKDIDNVRPLSSVMEWIYYRIKSEDQGQIRKAIDETFDKVAKDLLKIQLVRKWRSPETLADEAIRAAASPWFRWIPNAVLDMFNAEDLLPLIMGKTGKPESPEKDVYVQAAYHENIWREKSSVRIITYGHTHFPLQVPLDGNMDREVFYLNSGTWRNRMHKTVGLDKAPDFVNLKQITYTIFYRKDEDTKGKASGTVSFDVWTGNKKKYYRQ
jgi:UDP-2,3-diacylglucosamine pyrophosphatase LpxH